MPAGQRNVRDLALDGPLALFGSYAHVVADDFYEVVEYDYEDFDWKGMPERSSAERDFVDREAVVSQVYRIFRN